MHSSTCDMYLGVYNHPHCLFRISCLVQVHCAEAVCVSHHGYASAVLDISNKAVTTSGNDQVDILVKLKQGGDFSSCLNGLNISAWNRSFRKSGLDCL